MASVAGNVVLILALLPEHFSTWSVRCTDRADSSAVKATHTYTSGVGISTALKAASTGTSEDFEEEAEDAFVLPCRASSSARC